MKEFWTFATLEITEVAERLKSVFRFSDPEFNGENRFHWFDVAAQDGLRLNVSRKHGDEEDERWEFVTDFTVPLRIQASGYENIDDLGRQLATCLATAVYYGDVEYLGGDDFRYVAVNCYESGT